MGKSGCAVLGCEPSKTDGRHRFPNPTKRPNLFEMWLQIIANSFISKLDDDSIYKTYRVCSKHFVRSDFGSNNKLRTHRDICPTLYISKQVEAAATHDTPLHILLEHDYCSKPEGNDDNFGKDVVQLCTTVEHSSPNNDKLRTLTPPPGLQLLAACGLRRSAKLTPKAKFLYKQAVYYKRRASRVLKKTADFKKRLAAAEKCSTEKSLINLAGSLKGVALQFFKNQISCAGKKSKGRRFTVEDKILALSLYKHSPSAYRLLSALFAMPSRVTLQKLLARIPITPGVSAPIFEGLKRMSAKNRECVLMFDEMSLQPHLHYNAHTDEVEGFENFGDERTQKIADHVQVFTLRGIHGNWKQPVAYTFVKGAMKGPQIIHKIKEIVCCAKQSGFKIVATVCDNGTNNVSAINELVKSTQATSNRQHDYVFEVQGEKIIPLYDTPHLLKCVRNNLLKRNIFYKNDGVDRVAKWEHIYKAWEMDALSGDLRAMPKLTEYHVDKQKIKKIKVSVAAQVFSHSVASTINLLTGKKFNNEDAHLEDAAKDTAIFAKFFDNLFDSVNGSASFSKTKPLRTAVKTTDDAVQISIWKKAIPVLKSLYVYEEASNGTIRNKVLPCFKHWWITLENLVILHSELRKRKDVKHLKTRSFQQDPLENFFGQIRQRGQRNINPTVSAFSQYYKSLLVKTLISKHSPGANCEEDGGNILLPLQHFITQGLSETEDSNPSVNVDVPLVPKHFDALKPLESAALAYVAGYIIKARKHIVETCTACKYNVLKRESEDDRVLNKLVKAREYGNNGVEKLKYCNVEFVKNLTKLYNLTKFILRHRPERQFLLKRVLSFTKTKLNFNFIECEHSETLINTILVGFCKLIIFNYSNGLNNILVEKDDRKFPENVHELYVQARTIYEKRRIYKNMK